MEEEVGSHDGCYGPQVHPVPLLLGNHLTEELKESLKDTHMETCIQARQIKGIQLFVESNIPDFIELKDALLLPSERSVNVERPFTGKHKME